MDSTYSQIMLKLLKIKVSFPFTILFYKLFHSYNNFFYQMKVFSKVPTTHLYTNQKENKWRIS
jgi:hypothetical protein